MLELRDAQGQGRTPNVRRVIGQLAADNGRSYPHNHAKLSAIALENAAPHGQPSALNSRQGATNHHRHGHAVVITSNAHGNACPSGMIDRHSGRTKMPTRCSRTT